MPGSLYLVDSNVLLRWVNPNDQHHAVIASLVESIIDTGEGLCYTSQNLGEFWNVCTRPLDRNGYGLSPEETSHRPRFFESRARLLPETLSVHQEWRRLLVVHNVSGAQVYDARLVAAMRIHGVKHIFTFNAKDFARYSDIEAVQPTRVR